MGHAALPRSGTRVDAGRAGPREIGIVPARGCRGDEGNAGRRQRGVPANRLGAGAVRTPELIDVACVQQEDRGGAGDRQGCVRKAEGAVEHPVEEIRGEDVGPPSHVGRVLPKGARVLLTIAVTLPTTGERIDLLLWLCSQLLCIIVVTFAACDLGFCLGLRNL